MLRLLVLTCLIFSGLNHAQPLSLTEEGRYPLARHISYFITDNNNLNIEEIIKQDKNINWIRNRKDDLNLGFSQGILWQKVQIKNTDNNVKNWLVEFPYAQLDKIDFYLVNNETVRQHQINGDQFLFSNRKIKHPHSAFHFPLEVDSQYTIYNRIETSGSVQASMILWQWDEFNHDTIIHFLLQGLFFGFVILMSLYNSVVWIFEKSSIYLNSIIYILAFAVFQSSLSGIGYQFIWPSFPWINSHIAVLSLSIFFAAFNSFTAHFFELKEHHSTLNAILKFSFYAYCVFSVISIFMPYHISIVTISTLSIINICFIICVAFYMLKIKNISSKYFLLAWGAFLVGALLLSLNKFGIIPVSYASEYTLQFGAGFGIMFLSIALADRMSFSQKESLSLAVQINEEREKTFTAELENLRLEKQATLKLEHIVEERTKELTRALDHLSIAHDKLQTISITDALTELHNRYYFNEHYKIEYKRAFRDKTECSLILLDIDHFKSVNDRYGHPAGDSCLKFVANCIKQRAARESDICCRYGGEEFVIILPCTPLVNAYDLADDIRLHIERETVPWENQEIALTASFGVSSVIPIGVDKKHRQYLINQSDQALYEAKRQGRNRVVMFDPEIF